METRPLIWIFFMKDNCYGKVDMSRFYKRVFNVQEYKHKINQNSQDFMSLKRRFIRKNFRKLKNKLKHKVKY